MRFTYTLLIKAPIETVFAFVEEEDETKEWNPSIESVTNPDGFDPRHPVGTKFVQGIRKETGVEHVVGKVTGYSKPNRLCLRMTHYDYTVNLTYRLTRRGNDTQLHYESDLSSSYWLHRLFLPIMQFFNKRSIIKQLQMLRVAAEKA